MNETLTNKDQETSKRTTHTIKVGKNIQGIKLEFDKDGNFTEIVIEYADNPAH